MSASCQPGTTQLLKPGLRSCSQIIFFWPYHVSIVTGLISNHIHRFCSLSKGGDFTRAWVIVGSMLSENFAYHISMYTLVTTTLHSAVLLLSGKAEFWSVARSSGLSGYYCWLPFDFIHIFLALM